VPDLVFHSPTQPEPVRGMEGFKRPPEMLRTGFLEIHVNIDELIGRGDLAMSRWSWRGTQQGYFLCGPPTGRQVTPSEIKVHRLADCTIQEKRLEFVAASQMQQLGVSPRDPSAATIPGLQRLRGAASTSCSPDWPSALSMRLVIWLASPASRSTFLGPLAGGASGLYNTTRQLGSVLGTAVGGAVLQNRLDTLLYSQAVSASDQLPAPLRQPLIGSFGNLGRTDLEVGQAGQGALVTLPSSAPPVVRATLAVPIAVVLLAAASCLAVRPAARPAASMH
jgi:predicted ester cyclase